MSNNSNNNESTNLELRDLLRRLERELSSLTIRVRVSTSLGVSINTRNNPDSNTSSTNHSMMRETDGFYLGYTFCPVSGIICNTCEYRININPHWSIYHRTIRRHEHSSKNHPHTQSYDDRLQILTEFTSVMNDIAIRIIAAPTLDDVRSVLVPYLERGRFPYCTTCTAFVYDDEKRHSKRHQDDESYHCGIIIQREGYKSRMWNKKYSIIVPIDFELVPENICAALWEMLLEKGLDGRLRYWNSIGNTDSRVCCSNCEISNSENNNDCVMMEERATQNDDSDDDTVLPNDVAVSSLDCSSRNNAVTTTIDIEEVISMTANETMDRSNYNQNSDVNNKRNSDTTLVLHNNNDNNMDLVKRLEEMEKRWNEKLTANYEQLAGDHGNTTTTIVNRLNEIEERVEFAVSTAAGQQQQNQNQTVHDDDSMEQKLYWTEWQLRQMTRERDDAIQERDDAMAVSAEVTLELQRMTRKQQRDDSDDNASLLFCTATVPVGDTLRAPVRMTPTPSYGTTLERHFY